MKTYVYLMREVNKNLIKIGYSNKVFARSNGLLREHGYTLKVIACKAFENENIALKVEKFLHEKYLTCRAEKELFALTQEEIEDILSYFVQSEIDSPIDYFGANNVVSNYTSKKRTLALISEIERQKKVYSELLVKHNAILKSGITDLEHKLEQANLMIIKNQEEKQSARYFFNECGDRLFNSEMALHLFCFILFSPFLFVAFDKTIKDPVAIMVILSFISFIIYIVKVDNRFRVLASYLSTFTMLFTLFKYAIFVINSN